VIPWGVDRIDADLVWGTTTGSPIKVAVIDTGIDKDHPDLQANIKGGINFVFQKGTIDPTMWDDDNGHGTHVAGTIAAIDNEEGVIGVGPEIWLYAVKVLDRTGKGYLSDVVAGINWAINNDMDVISMSLGTSYDYQELRDACDAAYNAGIVIVAAAGNAGDGDASTNEYSYPAAYDSVIAVGATDSNDNIAWWSNSGPYIELAAPGVSIYSTYKKGDYETMSGTSMACPHVSGVIALMLTTSPGIYDLDGDGWDPTEIRSKLHDTAEDLGPTGKDNWYGYGLVDAEAVVS
jgi:subtilisin